MEMKPENVPDELLIQNWDGLCAVAYPYKYPRHCLRDLRYLHDWLRHPDDASR